jgi:Gpi18-like mannosyltransferase
MARKTPRFWQIVGLSVGWRLALLVIGLLASRLLVYEPSFPYARELLGGLALPRWFYSWANFDGVHYLTIAASGYSAAFTQAFFPIFPLILRLLPHYLIGGLILNLTLATLLVVIFYNLVKLDHSAKIAQWAVVGLLFFPTSFFLGTLYSESLFLLLVLVVFWLARQKEWLLAGLLAGIASATRVMGVFLWPALLLELWWQVKPTSLTSFIKHNLKAIVQISLSLLGLLAYMLYLWQVFDDPLFFLHVQSEFGAGRQESLVLFPQVIWRYTKILWTVRPFDWKYFSYVQDLVLSLSTLSALLVFFKKIRPSYLFFALLAFFLPPLNGTLSSMPRYLLVCFPLFILLGELWAKNKVWRYLLMTGSVALLIINTMLFIQGYWVA